MKNFKLLSKKSLSLALFVLTFCGQSLFSMDPKNSDNNSLRSSKKLGEKESIKKELQDAKDESEKIKREIFISKIENKYKKKIIELKHNHKKTIIDLKAKYENSILDLESNKGQKDFKPENSKTPTLFPSLCSNKNDASVVVFVAALIGVLVHDLFQGHQKKIKKEKWENKKTEYKNQIKKINQKIFKIYKLIVNEKEENHEDLMDLILKRLKNLQHCQASSENTNMTKESSKRA